MNNIKAYYNKTLTILASIAFVSCVSNQDDESGRRLVSLEYSEEGQNERNIYGMFYPRSHHASCDLIKESLSNGEVINIEYKWNGELKNVDPDEHDVLLNDLSKINLLQDDKSKTKFLLKIFNKDNSLLEREGFLDLRRQEHQEITLRIKKLCQAQWPPPL